MKKYKKLVFFFFLVGLLSSGYILTKQDNNELVEFPAYTTDKYIYNKYVDQYPITSLHMYLFGPYNADTIITDRTTVHYFNNGVTRIKTTTQTCNDIVTKTVEVWTTKNPSYVTWTNSSIIASLVALCAIGGYTGYIVIILQDPTHLDYEYYVQLWCQLHGKQVPPQVYEYKGQKDGKIVQDYLNRSVAYIGGMVKGISGNQN